MCLYHIYLTFQSFTADEQSVLFQSVAYIIVILLL
jgi:hypothetical protein